MMMKRKKSLGSRIRKSKRYESERPTSTATSSSPQLSIDKLNQNTKPEAKDFEFSQQNPFTEIAQRKKSEPIVIPELERFDKLVTALLQDNEEDPAPLSDRTINQKMEALNRRGKLQRGHTIGRSTGPKERAAVPTLSRDRRQSDVRGRNVRLPDFYFDDESEAHLFQNGT
eukprot:TRINITY_DN4131_c0_g1_i1.p2 TRINITY_DN4131_c0_g1~~TRINITY_DN4131_c0_g1_i1.p2  ORF type:complete len:171 (-),score=36.58 TRINITY_DN4131_c0_g1_i1:1328-1840(-)